MLFTTTATLFYLWLWMYMQIVVGVQLENLSAFKPDVLPGILKTKGVRDCFVL